MNWTDAKHTDIRTIHIRYEADVNSMWDVELKDGTKMGFYGYESGPHYESGPRADGSLWDDNEALYNWLCDIHLDIPAFDPDHDAVDFDLTLIHTPRGTSAVMDNLEVQKNAVNGADTVTKIAGVWQYKL